MHAKSDNIEILSHDKADQSIEQLFESLLSRYKIGLETSMKGIGFIFGCISLLNYKYHKINLNRGRSYIDCPDWI